MHDLTLVGLQEATLPCAVPLMSEHGRPPQSWWSWGKKRGGTMCVAWYSCLLHRSKQTWLDRNPDFFLPTKLLPPSPQSFSSQKMAPLSSLPNLSQGNHHFRHGPRTWPANGSPHSHSYFLLVHSSCHSGTFLKVTQPCSSPSSGALVHHWALRPNHPQRKAFLDSPSLVQSTLPFSYILSTDHSLRLSQCVCVTYCS